MIMLLLNILIMMIKMCASESSVYDWHVKTIESDSDFGDALKVETALNNERQQDLFKISGQSNNPNSYYNLVNRNAKEKSNKAIDAKENYQNLFKEQNSNFIREDYSKKDNKTKYGDYSDNGYNEDQYDKHNLHQNDIFANSQRPLHYKGKTAEFNRNSPNIKNNYSNDQDENKFNNHNADTVLDQDENKKPKINIGDHTETKFENEIKNNQTPRSKYDNKTNNEMTSVDNCSGKYIDIESFVGTNLFDSTTKKCFSSEDVALLTIRKDFESLIPKNLPQSLFDDHMVALLLNYFYISHQMIIQSSSINCRHMAQRAFYDTLGGYLNFYMVPVTKYSYYAGEISLNTAQQVLSLHQEARKVLNTNGNGWKAPLQNVLMELKSVHIEPLHIPELNENTRSEASFCMQLAMNTDDNQPDNDKMIVQLPKLETATVKGYLGNIWLPFNRKRTFDLKAEGSNYIVVKFYETVTKCYRFENIDQEFYNQQFKIWLLENIHTHLSDEEFYPGLGAVLRICEYLNGRRKNVIGIGNDLIKEMESEDEKYNKYFNHQIRSEQLHKRRRTKQNDAKENHNDFKKITDNDSKESKPKDIVDAQIKTVSDTTDNKLEAAIHSVSKSSKALLRSLDLTPPQIAIAIAIPVVAILFIIIICCWKCFCKKKKPEIPIKLKNSSSSSSNLFNSPVRFFNIKRKSASNTNAMDDYSLNEAGNKKNKKSVKIEKKPLINSDSSMSSSPIRNKKSRESTGSKDKTKSKDSDKK